MTKQATAMLGCAVERVCIYLVDDHRMTELHTAHLNIPSTTDVLTFAHNDRGEPIDVDIAVCIDEAGRHAARHGHACRDEVLLYVVHGLLHCTAYDDKEEPDAIAMHREEDRILQALGIGPVFSRGNSGDTPA